MTDHPHIITILPDIADNRAEWEVKPHQPTTNPLSTVNLYIGEDEDDMMMITRNNELITAEGLF